MDDSWQKAQNPPQLAIPVQPLNTEQAKPNMSKWLLILIIAAIFVFSILTFFMLNTKNKIQNNQVSITSTEYKDSINGFSVKHSIDWTAYNSNSKGNPATVVFSNNKLTVNVFVSKSTEETLDEWIAQTKKKQGQTLDRIIEEKRITVDGVEAQFTVREYLNTGQVDVVAVHKGKAYQIVAPITVNDTRTEVVTNLENFLKTFKFTQ